MLAISTSPSKRPQPHRRRLRAPCARRCAGSARRRRARSRGSAGARTPAARDAAGTSAAPGSTSLRRVCTPVAAVEHPVGQRRVAQRLAGVDVVLDPLGHLLPAGLLPQLERALLDAEAPAHREVDVARRLRRCRPGARPRSGSCCAGSPTGTCACGLFDSRSSFSRSAAGFFSMRSTMRIGLAAAGDVVAAGRVEALDVLADLLVETRAGLLAERAGVEQLLQRRRRGEAGVERVGVGGQLVLQRLDDMRHRVQPDHVGGAEGAAAGAAELLAGQVVDDVVAQAEAFSASCIVASMPAMPTRLAMKFGVSLRAHHVLAQAAW